MTANIARHQASSRSRTLMRQHHNHAHHQHRSTSNNPKKNTDPTKVSLDQVKEKALQELSQRFSHQLRVQRSDLTGLTFFVDETAKHKRLDISRFINKLHGQIKISENAQATNFIIIDGSLYRGRQKKIPKKYQEILDTVYERASLYVQSQSAQKLTKDTMQDQYRNSGGFHGVYGFAQPTNGRNLGHSSQSQAEVTIPLDEFKSWLPLADEAPLFGRQILANDLSFALKFLECQHAHFHNSRMKTMLLERGQERPSQFTDEGEFFVISKISSANDKKMQLQQMMDIFTRQVFHQYEKFNNPNTGVGFSGPSSSGVSPAKARVQVAVAQAQLSVQYQKASPSGCLFRSFNKDLMTLAKQNLRQQFDIHKLDMNTAIGFCPVISRTEKQFVMENKTKIEHKRELENRKEMMRQHQKDTDIQPPDSKHFILEPVPNENHTYCQVCNENYDDYLKHIYESETHKKRVVIQDIPFKEIDAICDELNQRKKWITQWKPDEPGHDQKMNREYKELQQGTHKLCIEITKHQQEHLTVSPKPYQTSEIKSKFQYPRPKTPIRPMTIQENNTARGIRQQLLLQSSSNVVNKNTTGHSNLSPSIFNSKHSMVKSNTNMIGAASQLAASATAGADPPENIKDQIAFQNLIVSPHSSSQQSSSSSDSSSNQRQSRSDGVDGVNITDKQDIAEANQNNSSQASQSSVVLEQNNPNHQSSVQSQVHQLQSQVGLKNDCKSQQKTQSLLKIPAEWNPRLSRSIQKNSSMAAGFQLSNQSQNRLVSDENSEMRSENEGSNNAVSEYYVPNSPPHFGKDIVRRNINILQGDALLGEQDARRAEEDDFDDFEEDEEDVDKQIRESMPKTYFHLIQKPYQDQTQFQQQLKDQQEDKSDDDDKQLNSSSVEEGSESDACDDSSYVNQQSENDSERVYTEDVFMETYDSQRCLQYSQSQSAKQSQSQNPTNTIGEDDNDFEPSDRSEDAVFQNQRSSQSQHSGCITDRNPKTQSYCSNSQKSLNIDEAKDEVICQDLVEVQQKSECTEEALQADHQHEQNIILEEDESGLIFVDDDNESIVLNKGELEELIEIAPTLPENFPLPTFSGHHSQQRDEELLFGKNITSREQSESPEKSNQLEQQESHSFANQENISNQQSVKETEGIDLLQVQRNKIEQKRDLFNESYPTLNHQECEPKQLSQKQQSAESPEFREPPLPSSLQTLSPQNSKQSHSFNEPNAIFNMPVKVIREEKQIKLQQPLHQPQRLQPYHQHHHIADDATFGEVSHDGTLTYDVQGSFQEIHEVVLQQNLGQLSSSRTMNSTQTREASHSAQVDYQRRFYSTESQLPMPKHTIGGGREVTNIFANQGSAQNSNGVVLHSYLNQDPKGNDQLNRPRQVQNKILDPQTFRKVQISGNNHQLQQQVGNNKFAALKQLQNNKPVKSRQFMNTTLSRLQGRRFLNTSGKNQTFTRAANPNHIPGVKRTHSQYQGQQNASVTQKQPSSDKTSTVNADSCIRHTQNQINLAQKRLKPNPIAKLSDNELLFGGASKTQPIEQDQQ